MGSCYQFILETDFDGAKPSYSFVEVTRLKSKLRNRKAFFNSKQDAFLIGSIVICVKVFQGSGIDKKTKKFVVRLQSCHIKLD